MQSCASIFDLRKSVLAPADPIHVPSISSLPLFTSSRQSVRHFARLSCIVECQLSKKANTHGHPVGGQDVHIVEVGEDAAVRAKGGGEVGEERADGKGEEEGAERVALSDALR